jgi:CRISPR-associated protein Csm1
LKGALPELIGFSMHKHTYLLLGFKRHSEVRSWIDEAKSEIKSAQILTLNETNFLGEYTALASGFAQPISLGFRFLGRHVPLAKYKPPKKDKILTRPQTFEEIACKLPHEEMDTNVPDVALEMIGAIRLDVDDLGYIFSHGIANASLGQIVTLSREMHYFFSVHFDQLAQTHQLYLIYSGGDDAFAVGQWEKLIQFTRDLQKDFKKYVFKNPAVNFSAGIFFGDPKYPVGRFYLDADELLKEAKSGVEKNRINIFSRTIQWGAFEKKIAFGHSLSELLSKEDKQEGKKLTMAFAYRLLSLVKSSFYERTEIVDGIKHRRGSINTRRFARNITSMRYLFSRNGYDKKKSDEIAEGIEKELITDFLRNFDFGKDQTLIDNLIALNYALYTIRSQKKTE